MDSNGKVQTLHPVHGPGPPDQQQDMIPQLKRELETCRGKIKGYETLGHLLQESKQECARYKRTNDELAKQLDSLTRQLLPCEPSNETIGSVCETSATVPSVHAEGLGAILTNNKALSVASNESIGGEGEGLRLLMKLPVSLPAELESSHLAVRTPPQRSPDKSVEILSASSASFVQISNSEPGSPKSQLSSIIGDDSAQLVAPRSAVGIDANADQQTSMDITSEISHITEHLRTIGRSSSNTSVDDLAADLVKASVNVIKLQKQCRVQQVMMNQMSSQIAELKADCDAKQQMIQILQKDCNSLRNTVKQMEVARDQALEEAEVMCKEKSEERDESTGGPRSVEWVEVETQRHDKIEKSISGTSSSQVVVTAVPMVEMELRRRIEKLSSTISELVSVNHSWDEHCRQVEATHEHQMSALQSKLNECSLRLEEYERGDQQRQIDFDKTLLDAKKQREAEEMAKEEALTQLHLERQRLVDSEQKCNELSRKTVELEQRLIQRQNSQQIELSHHLQTTQLVNQTSSDKEKQLVSQLLILQEQVGVFKEDFDQERRDREWTQANMEKLRKKHEETTAQLTIARSQLMQTTAELTTAKSDGEHWRQRFIKLSNDVQSIQRQARPLEPCVTLGTTVSPPVVHVSHSTPLFVGQQLRLPSTSVRLQSWTCDCCTFSNPGERMACEMCGKAKSDIYLQPNYVTGGRSVAGLQDLHPAMPNTGQRSSRRLETDFINSRP